MNRDPKGTPQLPPKQPPSSSSQNTGNNRPDGPTGKGSLAEAAKTNKTLLGDHTSLRAEYTDTQPTENDLGAKSSGSPVGGANDGNVSSKNRSGNRGESPQRNVKFEEGQGYGKGNERKGGPTGKGSLADAAKKSPVGDPTSVMPEKKKDSKL